MLVFARLFSKKPIGMTDTTNAGQISIQGTTTIASLSRPRRLYISNSQRDVNEGSYKFSVHFQNAIQDCKGLRLLNSFIGLNAYNFPPRHSQITFTALGAFYSLTIPAQQYSTPQQVADAINTLFIYGVPDSMFQLLWDANTLRYSLKCLNVNPAFYSEFTNGANSIWKRLGFDDTQFGVPMNGNTVVAKNSPKLVRTSCIYISSPSISTNEGVSNSTSQSVFQRKNILAVIPVTNGNYGAYQHFNDPIDVFRAVMLNPVLQTLDIELFDDELYLFSDLDGTASVFLELDLEY